MSSPQIRPPHPNPPFPERIPEAFANKIDKANPADPLALQLRLDPRENDEIAGFVRDPTGDQNAHKGSGFLHKYRARALWLLTGKCAGHCRFCFRRHYPYEETVLSGSEISKGLDHLARDTGIEEVVLSGGDPLTLPDRSLSDVFSGLADLPHIRTLRIHTRLPVFSPGRFTPGFLKALSRFPRRKALVAHVNHPRELDGATERVFRDLAREGTTLLSQSVLLRGVNDEAATLSDLMKALWHQGVTPYYLHQLDPVHGAAHFHVPVEKGRFLLEALRASLPGYLVPRYVQEIPGDLSKRPL
ncbi:MAG: KamA family radical SAM protein [Spirochaetes bacterium]|nr:KamA family radical SAM protein [Spirochaetota bacterium]